MRPSHQLIIDAAVDGEVGRLVFPFRSADRDNRKHHMCVMLRRIRLGGFAIRLLLNPEDAEGQPIPVEAEGRFRAWGIDASVPVGEFHLAISRVQ